MRNTESYGVLNVVGYFPLLTTNISVFTIISKSSLNLSTLEVVCLLGSCRSLMSVSVPVVSESKT